MKKFALLFILIVGCNFLFAQQPESFLTNFEGTEHLDGISYWTWSGYYIDTVDNDVYTGINTSEKCIYHPAHYFDSGDYGVLPGFQFFSYVNSDSINKYNYLYFDVMYDRASLSANDTITYQLKFEGSTQELTGYSKVIVTPGQNEWQKVAIKYEGYISATDHTTIGIMANPISQDSEVGAYYDNFGFTTDTAQVASGIFNNHINNDFTASIINNQLIINMEKETFISDFQVYNINGAMILTKSVNAKINHHTFPVNLKSGIYFIKVRSNDNVSIKKIINYK